MEQQVKNVNRREFIVRTAVVGGGMAIALSAPGRALAAYTNTAPWSADAPSAAELTPWIAIDPDGTVTIRNAPPEIGNGVLTQGAMTINEELNADWSKIRAEFASTNRNYLENNVYSTAGAALAYFSGRSTGPDRTKLLLQVGASARERLKMAAANQWGVPVGEVTAKDSVITHTPSGRTLGYGDVAAAAAQITLDTEPTPKPSTEWTTLGKVSYGKINNPLIVNGSAVYGIDVQVPDMVYAALKQAPVMGGKLKSYDADAVKDMPGVLAVVVVDPSEPRKLVVEAQPPFPLGASLPQAAVAVIAEHYWQARTALDALPVEWDDGDGAQWKTTEQVRQALVDATAAPAEKVEMSVGDAATLLASADGVVEGTYYNPYTDHVNMEPLNGTCLVTDDRVELWMPTQHTQQAQFVAAEETSLDPSKVFVHQTYVGTGFGRRVFNDDTRMVVAVARKFPGRPVKVIWNREEAMRQGRYRPAVAARFRAHLGDDGLPDAFQANVAGKGIFLLGLVDTAYVNGIIPNVQIETVAPPLHILTGPYRGPGYNSFCFFFEVFMDELAEKAGVDPLDYRLKLFANYPDKGWTMTLTEAAKQAEWGKELPEGWGQGIAIGNWGMGGRAEAGTTVAVVATVEVSKDGHLTLHRLDAAVDTGRYMNADALLYNLQGGLIMGSNMSVNEQMEITDGVMSTNNYDVYPMLRIGDAPRVVNITLDGMSGNERFGEIGESPMGPVGPAIANAISKAIGRRIREQPYRLQDLKWG
jgi:isoquinoline 1-oxidoreductase beta subunit